MPRVRRGYSKRRYHRRYGSKLNKRQVKQVKRLMDNNTESKYIEYDIVTQSSALTAIPVQSPGALYSLITVPRGTGDTNRIGDVIHIKSLHLRYAVTYTPGALTVQQLVRVIIFQHMDNIQPAANGGNENSLMDDIVTLGGTGVDPGVTGFITYDSRSKFSVVYDKTHVMIDGQSNDTHFRVVNITAKKIRRKMLKYFAGDNTVGIGQFYIGLYSSYGTAAANPPTFSGTVRVIFDDA